MRDEVVDYIRHWTERTESSTRKLLGWLGLGASKFYDWRTRYGQSNEHNSQVPRDFWLEDWEKRAILDFHDRQNPRIARIMKRHRHRIRAGVDDTDLDVLDL